MEKDKLYIGESLRRVRIEKDITQEELAEYSKLSRTFIGDLENNKKAPSLRTIFQLARGLGISAAEFVREIESDIDFDEFINKRE